MNERKLDIYNRLAWVIIALLGATAVTLAVLFIHSGPRNIAIEPVAPATEALPCVEEVPEPESDPAPAETKVQSCVVVVEEVPELHFSVPLPNRKATEYIPDQEDVDALAKTLWGECRGVPSKMEQAAVAWCVLNRLDAGYADTVLGVVAAPGQFVGYSPYHPVTDELAELAADVLERHWREQQGETDVGRVLPAEYLWFSGRDGRNWFRPAYRSSDYWDWSLPDPYEEPLESA